MTSDTIDFIILLDEMDHAEDLQDKNVPVDIYTSFDDIQDAVDGTRLEEVSISHTKLAAIEDPESDVFVHAFPEEPVPPTEKESIVMEVVSKCPDVGRTSFSMCMVARARTRRNTADGSSKRLVKKNLWQRFRRWTRS